MVVAQIPLWLVHGNGSTNVGNSTTVNSPTLHWNTPKKSRRSSTSSTWNPDEQEEEDDDDYNDKGRRGEKLLPQVGNENEEKVKLQQKEKAKSYLHLWDPIQYSFPSELPEEDIGGVGVGVGVGVGIGGNKKRSPIYCCDILTRNPMSQPHDTSTTVFTPFSRIATGGGDGQVKIWNLEALFLTDNLTSRENTTTSTETDPMKRKKQMAHYEKHVGYISSDESTGLTSRSTFQKDRSREDTKEMEIDTTTTTTATKTTPRLLCTLTSHSGSVLTVRFSTFGTYLASAGDDSYIFIYARPSSSTFSSTGTHTTTTSTADTPGPFPPTRNNVWVDPSSNLHKKNIEPWNRIHILRGHNLDVVGLAWAPDDTHLISCSFDSESPICIWKLPLVSSTTHSKSEESNGHGPSYHDAQLHSDPSSLTNTHPNNTTLLRPFKIVGRKEHSSTVKGVTFDPAGKYFISSGDDPAICIWRAFDDWGLERKMDVSSGIFYTSTTTSASSCTEEPTITQQDLQALSSLSLFRRISFAPDGAHFCATNATLKGKNIAAIVSRDNGWVGCHDAQQVNPSSLSETIQSQDHSQQHQAVSVKKKLLQGVKSSLNGTTTNHTSHDNPYNYKKGNDNGRNKSHAAVGAANLIGHKQPVVSSRYCPYFFQAQKPRSKDKTMGNLQDTSMEEDTENHHELQEEEDDDRIPNYGLLLALGDKKGFVTVWSTKKSRPIFKIQCSETKCTVTDMAWGLLPSATSPPSPESLVLIISLLDGLVVALQFRLPDEVGYLLSEEKKRRIFRLKYGIDLGNPVSSCGRYRRLVDDKTGPQLIENVFEYNQEDDNNEVDKEADYDQNHNERPYSNTIMMDKTSETTQSQVVERVAGGKKRIRPVLLSSTGNMNQVTEPKPNVNDITPTKRPRPKGVATVHDVFDDAEKAASAAENIYSKSGKRESLSQSSDIGLNHGRPTLGLSSLPVNDLHNTFRHVSDSGFYFESVVVPASKEKVHSVDLTTIIDSEALPGQHPTIIVGSCLNSIEQIPGSNKSIPSITVSITEGSKVHWRDQIPGASCTTLASSSSFMAVGTLDGSLYLYSTSPTSGWASGIGIRSHPPFILKSSIVLMHFRDERIPTSDSDSLIQLLILTSDGSFGVYTLTPMAKLLYSGSILAPLNHIRNSTFGNIENHQHHLSTPTVSRMQFDDGNRLILILSSTPPKSSSQTTIFGGPLFAFFYNCDMELWIRISDSRFSFSNFYSSIPGKGLSSSQNYSRILGRIDDVIQSENNKKVSLRKVDYSGDISSTGIFNHEADESKSGYLITRAHCEDRMCCALALSSVDEFRHWFRLYIRNLAAYGHTVQLRLIVDIFIGFPVDGKERMRRSDAEVPWLSAYRQASGIEWNGCDIVKNIIIPEVSKHSSLQRLANEIDMELKFLDNSKAMG